MASKSNLSRIEEENTVLFGLKWSVVGMALAVLLLAGCSSLFDQRVPRYNSVSGERRAPIMNPGAMAGQPDPRMMQQEAMQAYDQAVPVAPVAVQQQAEPLPMPAPVAQARHTPAENHIEAAPQATAPVLPATNNAVPLSPTGRQVEAQINALERDLDAADSRRQAMAQQENDNSWLPDVGLSEMWEDTPQAAAPAPTMQPATNEPSVIQPTGGYKVVKLPPPPMSGEMQPAAQPIVTQPTLVQPQLVDAPVSAMVEPAAAPMPPMITTPPANSMANAPVIQPIQPALDVPLAPDVATTAPQHYAVPITLVPPSSGMGGDGYLPESRYARH